jgi:penicillin-binding protein 1C
MRRVSGVAGAAPLWNRIMLHLHEQREPPPFPSPEGMVLRDICAQTGYKPTPDCDAVVAEYLWPEDVITYERPQTAAVLPREYDEWLALQHRAPTGRAGFRILAPRDGDAYLVAPVLVGRQRLELQAATPRDDAVVWRLNGVPIGTGRNFFWAIKPGRFVLEASSGSRTDRVSFEIEAGKLERERRRGFSFIH